MLSRSGPKNEVSRNSRSADNFVFPRSMWSSSSGLNPLISTARKDGSLSAKTKILSSIEQILSGWHQTFQLTNLFGSRTSQAFAILHAKYLKIRRFCQDLLEKTVCHLIAV
jgi:hypothetical protein